MEEKPKQNLETNHVNDSQGDLIVKPVNTESQAKPVDTVNTAPQVVNKEPVVEQKVSVIEQPVVEQKNKDREFPVNKNAAKSDKKPFIAGNWIKLFVFLAISLLIFVLNFMVEKYLTDIDEDYGNEFVSFDYSGENILPEMGVFRFDNNDLDNEPEVNVLFNNSGDYVFELLSGRMWNNLRFSNANVNILVDNILVIPNNAAFDLNFNGTHVDLSVYNGDVYLAFLRDSYSFEGYVDPYSEYFIEDLDKDFYNDYFINTLVVPQNMEVEIPIAKVIDDIGPLLRSKLVKELKYGKLLPVNEMLKDDDLDDAEKKYYSWVKFNLDSDNIYVNAQEKSLNSKISLYDGFSKSNFITRFIFWAEENLLFVPEKKKEIVFEHTFSYLDNAIYYLLRGDIDLYQQNLLEFNSYLSSLSIDFVSSDQFKNKFDSYLDDFKFFDVSDPEYVFLQFVLGDRLSGSMTAPEAINILWQGVYFALLNNQYDAEIAFDYYYEAFDNFLIDYSAEFFMDNFVNNHNYLLSNLFLHYPSFYKKEYFDIKAVYESNVLKNDINSDQLSQDFISEKITFLKHLRMFFFQDLIDADQAKEVYLLLLVQIEDLMRVDSSFAVTEFFESELDDMNDFYAYLNSNEYHSASYGSTHEERYNTYLKERTTFLGWSDIKSEINDDLLDLVTIESVTEELEDFFESNSELSNLVLLDFEDVNSRYVTVEFVLGGYPVEAVYDRSIDALKDVYVYGELVASSSVKLESLLSILQDRFLNEDLSGVGNDELTIEALAQSAAKDYVAKQLSLHGFVVKIEDIAVVEELNAIYRVENTYLDGFENKRLMFDILMASDALAIDVLIIVDGSPIILDGKYSLEELAELVLSETDF